MIRKSIVKVLSSYFPYNIANYQIPTQYVIRKLEYVTVPPEMVHAVQEQEAVIGARFRLVCMHYLSPSSHNL